MSAAQAKKPLCHRFFIALALVTAFMLSACGGEGGDTYPPFDCEQNPCDPSCYEGCSLACEPCSEACVNEGSAPALCEWGANCDPLCDPCETGCEACEPACPAFLSGPELEPARCDAVALNPPGETPRRWRIEYAVPAGVPSWLLSVFTDDVQSLLGVHLTLPDASTIDLDTYDEFTLHQQRISPAMLSMVMPSAPRYASHLQAGEHSLIVEAEGDAAPCWTLTPQLEVQKSLPFRLRVRVIGVGPSLGTLEELRENALLRDAFMETRRHFANAEISFYVHEWLVLDDEARMEHGEVSSFEGVSALLRSLPPPTGGDANAELAVNVVLIDRFSGSYVLQGLTGGLPGPVSLHGSSASGVVISTALLGRSRGTDLIGALIAHELGHYLGLRHTSSYPSGGEDPLEDTPSCEESVYKSAPFSCPDAQNMMFPLLSVNHTNHWSDEQKQVLQWHPSVTQRSE